MLRENIPCRAVLALTATATKATEASMVQALGIAPSAVYRDASLRDNLRFNVHHTNGGELDTPNIEPLACLHT